MPKPFKSIIECKELRGKYVFLRASINVPIVDGEVLNQFRVTRGLATINYLVNQGARVILCGHIGSDGEQTAEPVARLLGAHVPILFSPEVAGVVSKNLRDTLEDGQVLMLENVRKDPREKKNDANFARELADMADIYVNDAFAASHREHASLVGVPQFIPSYVGLNFVHEYEELSKALNPKSPSLFMLGGAKFDTKMPLVEKFIDLYDELFIGGALANDLFKAKGYEIGASLISSSDLTGSTLLENNKIILPVDVIVESDAGSRVTTPDDVHPNERIVDAGPLTTTMLSTRIAQAQMVLWNGPLGSYEEGYEEQTVAVAKLVAESEAYSVIGGGDTVAAIEALCCQEQYNFLSTAGGAMLTFLEKGTLPAIEVLKSTD